MAYVTREFFKELKDYKIIGRNDWSEMAALSREAGLHNGAGYSNRHFKNAVNDGVTVSDNVMQLIMAYYQPKIELLQKQRQLANGIKKRLGNPELLTA